MAKWQYGVILDAGSSGTRLHVYRWLDSRRARQDADEDGLRSLPVVKTKKAWTKKIKPGVSTFGDTPELVGPDHLKELFAHALDIIPEEAVQDTPIFLLATAGVRLLPDIQRKELLRQICVYARTSTSFLLPDCDLHIQVIPGETEGLYGWIAANYLLGGFDNPEQHAHGKGHHTYGFLDMGGASAQIAFAPNVTEAERHAKDLKLLRMRTIDGALSEYKVFVTTWLGFGVNEARKRYVAGLLEAAGASGGELPDPCLPVGLRITTEGEVLLHDTVNGKNVHLVGTGKFEECLHSTTPLLDKDAPCDDEPCLLHGIHVPAIDFDVNHFVGVSEYWHTTHEVFEMAHKDKAYDFATYQKRVKAFCTRDWSSIKEDVKDMKFGKKVDENTAVQVCFKASWLINVLHNGIGVPREGLEDTQGSGHNGTKEVLDNARAKGFTDSFQAVDKIDDTEVSWTLGKMILYAASQVPPSKTNNLPVGFGSNEPGVSMPADFQYAGILHSSNPNITHEHDPRPSAEPEGWRGALFEGKSPRRIPGFLLFMLIICIAIFLLCGKDRRSRFYQKMNLSFSRSGKARRRGIFLSKTSFGGSRGQDQSSHERLLEDGMGAPEDFELDSVEGDYDEHSDSSSGSKTGKASGWATPSATPKLEQLTPDLSGKSAAFGLGPNVNAMSRSGLLVRHESREKLHGLGLGDVGRRSRRGSPTRSKTPLMSPLAEYRD